MNNYITTCLGRNIRFLRQYGRMSAGALGKLAGISTEYVGLIERGLRYPSASVLEKLAGALKVSVYRLFQDERAVFEYVEPAQWSELQGKLEQITVLTEEMHDMLEVFQKAKESRTEQ